MGVEGNDGGSRVGGGVVEGAEVGSADPTEGDRRERKDTGIRVLLPGAAHATQRKSIEGVLHGWPICALLDGVRWGIYAPVDAEAHAVL